MFPESTCGEVICGGAVLRRRELEDLTEQSQSRVKNSILGDNLHRRRSGIEVFLFTRFSLNSTDSLRRLDRRTMT
jgi:hypothetical protein